MGDEDNDDVPRPDDIQFLSFEDVCEIHDRGLIEFGEGIGGFIDVNVVRSAVAQPQASVFRKYMYEFPAGMAAAYLYFLASQQGFVQGNKRAAVGSAVEFLARNGYELDVTNLDLFYCVKRIAAEERTSDYKEALKELQAWVEDHLVPMP